jgi:hypothetical protein
MKDALLYHEEKNIFIFRDRGGIKVERIVK